MEKQTAIHRLENPRRSPFDAFLYVNRIPDQPREDETAHQLAGRIHGRLANQEGRVLLKLPPGMSEAAYRGFKTFLGSEGNPKITNCAACHSPPAFGIAEGNSLRTGKWSSAELETILKSKIAKAAGREAAYAGLKISKDDIPNLIAFQETLKEVNDESFRDLILSATVVDVAAAPKTTKMAVPLSLSGSVRFEGPRPERKPLPMDEASRKLYDGKSPLDEATLISKSGGLANVFVFVKNPPKGDYRSSAAPAVIDQQKSMFRPRVQGLRVGEGVVMKNGDPFIHNIRSLSRKNRPFNIAQPAGAPDRKRTFEVTEGPITIKCDFHRWMTAHFFVMDHPFFAVTDLQGHFEIPNLPPGGYTLAAWHEVFGELELKVTTGKGATSETGFTFRPKEN
jgi:mono/diheme cytochrome c family protein/plastocyanin